MTTSQILKFVDFTKTQKSWCLENKLLFAQIKNWLRIKGYFMANNGFVAEVNFRNVEEKPTAKNYCPVYLLSLVSKAFEEFE